MVGSCCTTINSYVAPSLPCNQKIAGTQHPQDLLEAIIDAILALKDINGSTSEEILNEIQREKIGSDDNDLDFFSISVDPVILNRYLLIGTRRGVLKQSWCGPPSTVGMDGIIRSSTRRYLIRSNMTLLNPQNEKYTRCVCDFYQSKKSYQHPSHRPNYKNSSSTTSISLDGISDQRPGACSTCHHKTTYLTPCGGGCYSSF